MGWGKISTLRLYCSAALWSLWCKTAGQSWQCVSVCEQLCCLSTAPWRNTLSPGSLLSWACVALCPAQAWAFSFEKLSLCEMQQQLSGQEFQLDTASAAVVWWGCAVSPARAVAVGPCCLGLVGPAQRTWAGALQGGRDGWRDGASSSAVCQLKYQKPPTGGRSYPTNNLNCMTVIVSWLRLWAKGEKKVHFTLGCTLSSC